MADVIGFVGYECEDIVIYLAKILSRLGKRVIVVDKTEQEMLLLMLGLDMTPDSEQEMEYEGIELTNGMVHEEGYDIILMLFGYRLNHPRIYSCEKLILITDGVPAHAKVLRRIGQWNKEECLIIRNLISLKHGTRYLCALAGRQENSMELFLEEADVRARCSLGPGGRITLQLLSKEMRKVLLHLVQWILQEDRKKEIMTLIQKEERRRAKKQVWGK